MRGAHGSTSGVALHIDVIGAQACDAIVNEKNLQTLLEGEANADGQSVSRLIFAIKSHLENPQNSRAVIIRSFDYPDLHE
jgi:hypothetical protein